MNSRMFDSLRDSNDGESYVSGSCPPWPPQAPARSRATISRTGSHYVALYNNRCGLNGITSRELPDVRTSPLEGLDWQFDRLYPPKRLTINAPFIIVGKSRDRDDSGPDLIGALDGDTVKQTRINFVPAARRARDQSARQGQPPSSDSA